jgi:hypothetical protein
MRLQAWVPPATQFSSTALILMVLIVFCSEVVFPTALWAQGLAPAPTIQPSDELPPIQRTESIAKPPFYKRWWFWTLVAVVVVGGVAAAAAGGGGDDTAPTGTVNVTGPPLQ